MNRHSSKMFIVSESGSVRETDICEAEFVKQILSMKQVLVVKQAEEN